MQDQKIRLAIRWMLKRDMDDVAQIERSSFDDPHTKDELAKLYREASRIAMVCEVEEKIVGFMFYSLRKNYLRLDRIAVHPKHRLSGVGRSLVERLKGKLSDERRTAIYLQTSEYNTPAHLFFSRLGFVAVDVFNDGGETVYEFKYIHGWDGEEGE